jgi:NADPH:quinone reductase
VIVLYECQFLQQSKTMKAIIIEQFGNPETFKEVDLATPDVLPHHVLIQVAATSVNPVDYKIRQGVVADIAPNFPAILHGDVAGTIAAVGAGVDRFRTGDEVYACAGGVKGMGGALAEYMLADARLVAHKPKSLTMAEAAALPLVSITAWEGLIDRAKIQPGQKVLVYGATVYALVSSDEKAAIAHRLGADVTINYCHQPVEEFVAEHTNGQGFDVVFDTVGNDNLQNAFKAAKLNGIVASIVSLSQQDLTLLHAKGLTLHLVFMLIPMLFNGDRARHGEILSKLAQIVDEGKIRPLLDSKTFSMTELASAHRHAESGQAIGKVVLTQSFNIDR